MTIDELQERFNELRKKKWRTVSGHVKAEFTGFRFDAVYPFFIQLETGEVHTINLNLFFFTDSSRPYIEEVSPYANWPIDAKVLVWGENKNKNKRYFAGIHEDGRPMAWIGGATSWSDPTTFVWDYAELAEN